ncbi:MAG: amidohydrolase [Acidobacteria bacterium]|nr:amidohydrolase [Acidobacteriota bacterium]
MPLVFGVTAWFLIAAHALFGQQMPTVAPDTIFYNGKIIMVDSSFSIQEAFAVRGDQIWAVGSNAQVRALAGPQTRSVDLLGHAVIPGMMDNHNHQYHAALMSLRGVDLEGIHSLAEMLDRIRQGVAAAPPGKTVSTTVGWNPTEFPEKRPPNRQDLDQVSPNNPVVVYQSRSLAYLNTAALNLLGINRDVNAIGRAVIAKDPSGNPTGAISGAPAAVLNLTAKVVPQPTIDEKKDILLRIAQRQLALGLTSIRDLQLHPEAMRAYYELWREERLPMRISAGLEANPEEVDLVDGMLRNWGVGAGFGDAWLRLDCVAEFNPGTLLREPFTEPAGNYFGELSLSEEKFAEAIRVMNRYDWRPSPHIDGDKTLDMVLDAYEAADRERSIRDRRWIVEHIALVQPDQMDRMKRLGVMVSAQIQPYRGARGMVRRWGEKRAVRAVPMRELLDHGLIVSGGSDWGGGEPTNNPFVNIYFYVTRNTLELGPFGVAQKISRAEAIRVETINNAYLTYEEKIKGSIEPGKLADFLILSHDILTVPEDQIRSILPLATYVGGRKVFSKPQEGF